MLNLLLPLAIAASLAVGFLFGWSARRDREAAVANASYRAGQLSAIGQVADALQPHPEDYRAAGAF